MRGDGTLAVTEGASVTIGGDGASIGSYAGSTGTVTIAGTGSTLITTYDLSVGYYGSATLEITGGGLVSVGGTLMIDYDTDGDGFVNMAGGAMLALFGDADDSLSQFLGLISGSDAIRYWDVTTDDWAPITGATPGVDYTLAHIGDAGANLYGYTLLTVGTISPPVPGDANSDGKVDDEDAKTLAAHWGQAGGWAAGDFNNDGVINALDAAIMAANWGHGVGETTESAVPEPSAFLLLLGLTGPLLIRRRASAR